MPIGWKACLAAIGSLVCSAVLVEIIQDVHRVWGILAILVLVSVELVILIYTCLGMKRLWRWSSAKLQSNEPFRIALAYGIAKKKKICPLIDLPKRKEDG